MSKQIDSKIIPHLEISSTKIFECSEKIFKYGLWKPIRVDYSLKNKIFND